MNSSKDESFASDNKSEIKLFDEVLQNNMLTQLIQQLNKDFGLSNIDFQIDASSSPEIIIRQMNKIVDYLLTHEFQGFLNLLYRIDLAESKMHKKEGMDYQQYLHYSTLQILQREWQKVWIRSKNL